MAMHKLHSLKSCVIFLCVVVASSGSAATVNQTELPPDLKQIILDWSTCRSNKVIAYVATGASDTDVVDKAMGECISIETKAMQIWETHYGLGSKQQLVAIREKWRSGLVAQVKNLRTDAPLTDPFGIWGRCVGGHIPPKGTKRQSGEAVANAALDACLAQQRAVSSDIAAKFGDAKAIEQMRELRSQMRKQVIATIEGQAH